MAEMTFDNNLDVCSEKPKEYNSVILCLTWGSYCFQSTIQVGRKFRKSLVQCPVLSRVSYESELHCWGLYPIVSQKTPKDGDGTTSPGYLFLCLTFPMVEMLFLISGLNLCCFTLHTYPILPLYIIVKSLALLYS